MVTFDNTWVFPAGETHLPKRMSKGGGQRVDGRLTYQYPLYLHGAVACRQRRTAVDVGAHVGLFSFWMVRDFARVVAFEPVEEYAACWRANMPARASDTLHVCALGAAGGSVAMRRLVPSSSGGTCVAGPGPIPLRTLDSFDLVDVDLLKVDCEGYELDVLRGAVTTLTRWRPVCIVEQRPKMVTTFKHGQIEAIQWLSKLGASVTWTDQRDYVLVFP